MTYQTPKDMKEVMETEFTEIPSTIITVKEDKNKSKFNLQIKSEVDEYIIENIMDEELTDILPTTITIKEEEIEPIIKIEIESELDSELLKEDIDPKQVTDVTSTTNLANIEHNKKPETILKYIKDEVMDEELTDILPTTIVVKEEEIEQTIKIKIESEKDLNAEYVPIRMPANNRFMHPRNIYRTPPDFRRLAEEYPEFRNYSKTGLNGKVSFDFTNQEGLRLLTTILLKKDFDLDVNLPVGKLIPTVPLRLNYLLWIEDLFDLNYDCSAKKIKGIDIGTGASCIYPLLAAKKFQWSMVGTDINKESIKNANTNVEKNNLQDLIQILEVSEWDRLLPVTLDEHYDFCMCNPPFHNFSNLNSSDDETDCAKGVTCELYTAGGEVDFVKKIIAESEILQKSISIYTTMVGYKSSLGPLKNELKSIGACAIAEAGFYQGRTTRWGIAWTFQPDIKLNDFLPNKMFQNMKLKPPVSFPIPDTYDSTTALAKLTELITNLKLATTMLKSKKDENVLFQADIKAYEDTWTHNTSRRKRRMEQRLADNKRQKSDDVLHNKLNDERVEQHLKTAANVIALFSATLVLRKGDDTIWIDMLHLDGNKNISYQVFQFFKNRFI